MEKADKVSGERLPMPIDANKDFQCLQLDLFSWDIIKIGEGFDALSRLDFNAAKADFEEVLLQHPGHPSAINAYEMATQWEGILQRLECLDKEEAMVFLWENIKGYPFYRSEGYGSFRKALIKRLLQM